MILKLNFWSFFSLHITFYQRLNDRMQAKKAKNALERPISYLAVLSGDTSDTNSRGNRGFRRNCADSGKL
jgi:hypothetical protein